MALNIRNPEAEKLAAGLARLTGESKTEAVTEALRDRLARVRRERTRPSLDFASTSFVRLVTVLSTGCASRDDLRYPRNWSKRRLADELEEIAEHCASLPVLDGRSAEEIPGDNDAGLPR